MPTPQEKLARSLELLQQLQEQGKVAIKTHDLQRGDRERLLKSGFLREVMKGWYILSRPDEPEGESTAWYASFWGFCAAYFSERFGDDWCLSPEQSVSLHAGNRTVPTQLVVRSSKASKNITKLLHNTSLLDVVASVPDTGSMETVEGLQVFSLPTALIACSPAYFSQNSMDVRAALAMVRDASDVLGFLLEGGNTVVAGRLAGAFRNIGRDRFADNIVKTMRAAGYDTRESDPFKNPAPIKFRHYVASPYTTRIRLMWQEMRGTVLENFPPSPPGRMNDIEGYLKKVEEVYVTDAYHSLSIEGYRVRRELIERVRSGTWNPDDEDREHRNALAARGYWQAYQAVRNSLRRILEGENPGEVADEDCGTWYRELFAPSVTAGILKTADLAGYRNAQVFIRRSMHVPPNREAVRDAMPAFFDLLKEEKEAAVRIVLGHFVFVYIHPYMDGNGRMGRFLMNAMLASGGYPWTIIRVEDRVPYMAALESASVKGDIQPFAEFIGRFVAQALRDEPTPTPPK